LHLPNPLYDIIIITNYQCPISSSAINEGLKILQSQNTNKIKDIEIVATIVYHCKTWSLQPTPFVNLLEL